MKFLVLVFLVMLSSFSSMAQVNNYLKEIEAIKNDFKVGVHPNNEKLERTYNCIRYKANMSDPKVLAIETVNSFTMISPGNYLFNDSSSLDKIPMFRGFGIGGAGLSSYNFYGRVEGPNFNTKYIEIRTVDESSTLTFEISQNFASLFTGTFENPIGVAVLDKNDVKATNYGICKPVL